MKKVSRIKTSADMAQWRSVKKSLRENFSFDDLRPGQAEVIRAVLARKNVLAIMPTGAGKSLCYQLPALQLSGTTVVVSPLISLMKDQKDKVELHGISAGELNSSIAASEIKETLENVSDSSTEIIYVTPERFTSVDFIELMKKVEIDFVVIDEAHCVSQWGHDFRPAYLAVGDAIKKLSSPPVLALTATATLEVEEDIKKQLGLNVMDVFRSSVFRENLEFEAKLCDKPDEKMEKLIELVGELEGSGIIYTSTVKAAHEVHEELAARGISSLLYHGKMKTKERTEAQDEFMNNSPRLMIATNAFGMGIDKSDIRFVIHFQLPGSLEAYYQEAGRAGRDGKSAKCILLYLKRDKATQALFLSGKYPSLDEIRSFYHQLLAVDEAARAQDADAKPTVVQMNSRDKKTAVILSLLKKLKIVRVLKDGTVKLQNSALQENHLYAMAEEYKERTERDHRKLAQIITYAQSSLCRWRNIRLYFHETSGPERCESCDNCKSHRYDFAQPLSAEATA